MRTTIKSLVLAIVAIIAVSADAAAQKISAAAVVDQHYASQTANYKFMMLALAAVYAVYAMLNMRRKRQIARLMGKSN